MEAAAELECSTADRDKYKEKRDKERQKERAKVEKDKENDEGTGKQNGHRHILKLFFTGKFEIFSTLLYLVIGWLIVFDFSTLSDAIGTDGVAWLFAGGAFYTIGILFYVIEKIPYNHVIWHLFVLGGAICHYLNRQCLLGIC